MPAVLLRSLALLREPVPSAGKQMLLLAQAVLGNRLLWAWNIPWSGIVISVDPHSAGLSPKVYRKSFRLNSTHGHEGGNIVSLVSTDCIKVYEGVQHCHNVRRRLGQAKGGGPSGWECCWQFGALGHA